MYKHLKKLAPTALAALLTAIGVNQAEAQPMAAALNATAITGGTAQLSGFVTPVGGATYWFQWGTVWDTNYSNVTPAQTLPDGSSVVYVTNNISGMIAGEKYHYRLVASNSVGVAYSGEVRLDVGTVSAWGYNGYGETSVPASATNIVAVTGGQYHSLALRTDGTILGWGFDGDGEIDIPASATNVVAIASGAYHCMALRNDGIVVAWGSNNNNNQATVPAGLSNVVAIACGAYHSVALRNDGTVVAWGYNNYGQINVPVGLTNVVGITGGKFHSLALLNTGMPMGWGNNGDGELNFPGNATNLATISGGGYHNVAMQNSGQPIAWGYNGYGNEGTVPAGITNVAAVVAPNCGDFSLALLPNGTMAGWGYAGDGATTFPTGLNNVFAIGAGGSHGLAVSATGVFAQYPASAAINSGIAYTNTVVINSSYTALSYQWYLNGTPISGQTGTNLIFNPVSTSNAGNYYVLVQTTAGSIAGPVFTITVNTTAQINQQPQTNFILFNDGKVTFGLTASGGQPLAYNWYANGMSITSATNTNYSVTNASASANYTCVVSNSFGSVTSSIVSLTVIAQPTNAYPQAVLADGPSSYWRLDEADTGYPNNGVIAHDYLSGHNGIYTNTELSQSGYSALPVDPDTAALFGNQVLADSDIGQISGNEFGTPNGGNAEFTLEVWANTPSESTLNGGIIAKGTGNGGEEYDLDTGGNNGSFRLIIRDASGGSHVAVSTVQPDGNWHHVVAVCDEVNGKILLYVDGVLNASASITSGSGLLSSANPVSIGARQSGSGDYDSQYNGTLDEVAIYNYALSPAQISAHYHAVGAYAPVITQQPTNTSVNVGSTATFTAVGSGTPVLSYQWYNVTAGTPGTPIASATSSTLTLNNVTVAQNGNLYAVVVTNLYGQAASSSAKLTVFSGPPTIQTDLSPLNTRAFAGTPIDYSVSINGAPPFSYQWLQDGNPVGANANTYTATTMIGTHTYSCTITNVSGSVSSSTATIVGVSVMSTDGNSSTNASTFAINFMDAANGIYTSAGGNTSYNQVYQGLGAYADTPANTNWNGFGLPNNGSIDNFNAAIPPQVAADGTLTPITLTLVYGSDYGGVYYGNSPYGTNTAQGQPSFLLGNCALATSSYPGIGTSANPLGGITISNVPSGTYTIYAYGANADNTRGATFNFSRSTALNGINATTNNANGSPASNFVYSVNYVIFTNVTPNVDHTITGTWGPVNNPIAHTSGEGDFCGLQLVRVSDAVPPILNIQLIGNSPVISWTGTQGILQSATSVTGPYTDVSSATSPYTNSASSSSQFFRLRIP